MKNFNKEHVANMMVQNDPTLSKLKAQEQLDSVIIAIIDTVAQGKDEPANKKGIRAKLTMVGFGSLFLKANPGRYHRNPQTGKEVYKNAHNAIKYTEGKVFYESIN